MNDQFNYTCNVILNATLDAPPNENDTVCSNMELDKESNSVRDCQGDIFHEDFFAVMNDYEEEYEPAP